MRKPSAVLTLISMLFAVPVVRADDHLVAGGSVRRALAQAETERAGNLASVEDVLKSPRAGKVATAAGIDLGRVRAALPQLSDAELRDLSRRAAALHDDPAAGHYHEAHEAEDALLVVFVVSAAALVLVALAHQ